MILALLCSPSHITVPKRRRGHVFLSCVYGTAVPLTPFVLSAKALEMCSHASWILWQKSPPTKRFPGWLVGWLVGWFPGDQLIGSSGICSVRQMIILNMLSYRVMCTIGFKGARHLILLFMDSREKKSIENSKPKISNIGYDANEHEYRSLLRHPI
jgi:hypothetical protein